MIKQHRDIKPVKTLEALDLRELYKDIRIRYNGRIYTDYIEQLAELDIYMEKYREKRFKDRVLEIPNNK